MIWKNAMKQPLQYKQFVLLFQIDRVCTHIFENNHVQKALELRNSQWSAGKSLGSYFIYTGASFHYLKLCWWNAYNYVCCIYGNCSIGTTDCNGHSSLGSWLDSSCIILFSILVQHKVFASLQPFYKIPLKKHYVVDYFSTIWERLDNAQAAFFTFSIFSAVYSANVVLVFTQTSRYFKAYFVSLIVHCKLKFLALYFSLRGKKYYLSPLGSKFNPV